jgi:Domain of unknown function (DUF1508)
MSEVLRSSVRVVKLYKTKKEWYFTGVARNGRIIITARGYNSKRNALKSAEGAFPSARIEFEGFVIG